MLVRLNIDFEQDGQDRVLATCIKTGRQARTAIGRYFEFYNARSVHSRLKARTSDVVRFDSLLGLRPGQLTRQEPLKSFRDLFRLTGDPLACKSFRFDSMRSLSRREQCIDI